MNEIRPINDLMAEYEAELIAQANTPEELSKDAARAAARAARPETPEAPEQEEDEEENDDE